MADQMVRLEPLTREETTATGAFLDAFLNLAADDPKLAEARPHIEGFRDKLRRALDQPSPPEHQAEGREERLEKALQGLLDAWLNCDRTLTEGEWEEMDEAEREARTALEGDDR